MSATDVAGVVVAGAVGAPARYLLDHAVRRRAGGSFPWGTLVVNASGSLLLGLLTGAALYHGFPDTPRVWIGTGFCGSYTTFSTFGYETVVLLNDGRATAAAANVAAGVVACAVAAAVGLALMAAG